MSRKIGVMGSGIVAKTLARGFKKSGYEVMIGSRDAAKLAELSSENIKTGSFAEAAAFGEMLVLAVKGNAAVKVLELAGDANIAGKTIIDTTNPIADSPPQKGVLKFFTTLDRSLMEELQEKHPAAHFVKCFSCVGNTLMVNPSYKEGKPSMFICGNNEGSKSEVKKVLDLFGYETEDMGKMEAARAIEPLCILWCIPGFLSNSWSHAFKILKK